MNTTRVPSHSERAEGRLSFENVVLHYRRSEQRVLDQISFEVEPGTTVAIVGRSGSGKSSLVNLIPRLYEYDSGEVRLDGVRLDQYNIRDLRRQISYVGQDVRLFNDSIRNNIAYGIADRSQRRTNYGSRQAGIRLGIHRRHAGSTGYRGW